jgi:hypothetical protein
MVIFHNRPISIMVLFAITLHLSWARLLLKSDDVLKVNAIHALTQWPLKYVAGSAPALAAVIAGVAILALIGLLMQPPWVVPLLVPQQLLLLFSAGGAINSVFLGHFADGAPYPPDFIEADQMYSILAAAYHTLAIVALGMRRVR